MTTITIDGMPLWLLARPQHISSLLDVSHPFLLINKHDDNEEVSPLAPTHELARLTFNPKIIRDFCNSDTMAIPLQKSHRNLSSLVTLGRSERSDIVLTSGEVSKSHCGFYKFNRNWFVLDLESTNGTTVNGREIEKAKLSSQSIIALGDKIDMAFITAIDLGFLVAEINAFE